jgi:hypothetical protein
VDEGSRHRDGDGERDIKTNIRRINTDVQTVAGVKMVCKILNTARMSDNESADFDIKTRLFRKFDPSRKLKLEMIRLLKLLNLKKQNLCLKNFLLPGNKPASSNFIPDDADGALRFLAAWLLWLAWLEWFILSELPAGFSARIVFLPLMPQTPSSASTFFA